MPQKPILQFGLFFDGTGLNLYNSEQGAGQPGATLILNKIAFVYMLYIVLIITCLIIGFTVYAYKKSEFGK